MLSNIAPKIVGEIFDQSNLSEQSSIRIFATSSLIGGISLSSSANRPPFTYGNDLNLSCKDGFLSSYLVFKTWNSFSKAVSIFSTAKLLKGSSIN